MEKSQYLEEIEKVIAKGPYKDTWESLSKHPIPAWYQNSKLGFFIHWGVYSVPAYGSEWYPHFMYQEGSDVYKHHVETWGENFEYHDFIPLFTADKFEPKAWLDMLEDCNADFVMPVAEHHDGFKMYDSELSKWNSVQMGPKRDVLGELKKESEGRGIRFAASNHRAEHYWYMGGGTRMKRKNATQNPDYREFYGPCVSDSTQDANLTLYDQLGMDDIPSREWLEDWLVSACEIVDKYQISCSYFDFWVSMKRFRPYMKKFLAYYYNRAAEWGKEAVSLHKMDAMPYPCGIYVRERGLADGVSARIWQCETSTAYNSWSYCTTNQFKHVEEIICNMIDVWSRNGCMVLNIGPMADGTICKEEKEILQTIAGWLQKNNEAIWGTMPFRVYGEGSVQESGSFTEQYHYVSGDFRFTCRLGKLYIFAMVPAGETTFQLNSLSFMNYNAIIKRASVLGEDVDVAFKQTTQCLELVLARPVLGTLPICFALEVE